MPVVSCHRASGLEIHARDPARHDDSRLIATPPLRSSPACCPTPAATLPGSPVTLLIDADDENAVVLRVEDRGPGVPHAECERIFDRGVSTHPMAPASACSSLGG